MNQKNTIEDILASGRKTTLSQQERSLMWSELRDYAEFHTAPTPQQPVPTPWWRTFYMQTAFGSVATAALLFMVGVSANNSLPGEALYSIKVDVIEPLTGLAYSSTEDRIEFNADLVEERLREMKILTSIKPLADEELHDLEEQLGEHIDVIHELYRSDDSADHSRQNLRELTDIVADVRSQAHIVNTTTSDRDSDIGSFEDSLTDLLYDEVTEYAEENPEAVPALIADILNEADDAIDALDEDTPAAAAEVSDYLDDIETAMVAGDLDEALRASSEIDILIDVSQEIETIGDSRATTTKETGE